MQANEKLSINSLISELENEIKNPPEEKMIETLEREIKDLIFQKSALGSFRLIQKAK